MRVPKPDTTIALIISALRASAFPRSPSTKASSSRATTKRGGWRRLDDYTAHHYHQPSDEYHPGMDWTSDAAMARFGFALGWEAANQAHLVGWRKGDEFERARLASQ